ncbi:hypothetical protein QWY85_17265 [Neolewinella lacunae]|uniref:Uncharacterized protein n=1 Tax=Neolewinella lacunae TaxID=1517758 RepID=A0A923T9T8_9BACT|nr:hypothetical protein [Neolewinella lacunae]MBC6995889.1 hypothetical protein [Neolewinella lacunae]MDN3636419.1 hypothetical protein [Neolewinella lacunae]
MQYPPEHFAIVNALFREGRFLLEGEAAFLALREQREFYQRFFHESFRLQLVLTADYALLTSNRDKDPLARSICIFLAVFCYELDQEDSNLLEKLSFGIFSISQWEERFEQSSFNNVLEATDKLRNADQRAKFYLELARRSLIDRLDDDHFRFTPAHRYFLEFARDLNVREMMNKA